MVETSKQVAINCQITYFTDGHQLLLQNGHATINMTVIPGMFLFSSTVFLEKLRPQMTTFIYYYQIYREFHDINFIKNAFGQYKRRNRQQNMTKQ